MSHMPAFYLTGTLIIFAYLGISQGITGTIITMIGYALWIKARIDLGDNFDRRSKVPNSLTTQGLYRHLRHPIYYFQTVVLIGLMLYAGVSYLWLMLIPYFIIQAYRIRKEEKLLSLHFGVRYANYLKRTI